MQNANNKKTENKKLITTAEAKRLVKAICLKFHNKIDIKNPRPKRDLNFEDMKRVMFLEDNTKAVYKELYLDDKLDTRTSLSKLNIETLARFKPFFQYTVETEDVEDVQNDILGDFTKWHSENFPTSKKRISESTVKLSELLTYMAVTNKDKPLPNLAKHGVNDFGTWRLKNLNMEASKVVREFIQKAS